MPTVTSSMPRMDPKIDAETLARIRGWSQAWCLPSSAAYRTLALHCPPSHLYRALDGTVRRFFGTGKGSRALERTWGFMLTHEPGLLHSPIAVYAAALGARAFSCAAIYAVEAALHFLLNFGVALRSGAILHHLDATLRSRSPKLHGHLQETCGADPGAYLSPLLEHCFFDTFDEPAWLKVFAKVFVDADGDAQFFRLAIATVEVHGKALLQCRTSAAVVATLMETRVPAEPVLKRLGTLRSVRVPLPATCFLRDGPAYPYILLALEQAGSGQELVGHPKENDAVVAPAQAFLKAIQESEMSAAREKLVRAMREDLTTTCSAMAELEERTTRTSGGRRRADLLSQTGHHHHTTTTTTTTSASSPDADHVPPEGMHPHRLSATYGGTRHDGICTSKSPARSSGGRRSGSYNSRASPDSRAPESLFTASARVSPVELFGEPPISSSPLGLRARSNNTVNVSTASRVVPATGQPFPSSEDGRPTGRTPAEANRAAYSPERSPSYRVSLSPAPPSLRSVSRAGESSPPAMGDPVMSNGPGGVYRGGFDDASPSADTGTRSYAAGSAVSRRTSQPQRDVPASVSDGFAPVGSPSSNTMSSALRSHRP